MTAKNNSKSKNATKSAKSRPAALPAAEIRSLAPVVGVAVSAETINIDDVLSVFSYDAKATLDAQLRLDRAELQKASEAHTAAVKAETQACEELVKDAEKRFGSELAAALAGSSFRVAGTLPKPTVVLVSKVPAAVSDEDEDDAPASTARHYLATFGGGYGEKVQLTRPLHVDDRNRLRDLSAVSASTKRAVDAAQATVATVLGKIQQVPAFREKLRVRYVRAQIGRTVEGRQLLQLLTETAAEAGDEFGFGAVKFSAIDFSGK